MIEVNLIQKSSIFPLALSYFKRQLVFDNINITKLIKFVVFNVFPELICPIAFFASASCRRIGEIVIDDASRKRRDLLKRLQVILWQLINVLILGFATQVSAEQSSLNMTQGVTKSAVSYDLHMLIFYICCACGCGLGDVLPYHQKVQGQLANHESTKLRSFGLSFPSLFWS